MEHAASSVRLSDDSYCNNPMLKSRDRDLSALPYCLGTSELLTISPQICPHNFCSLFSFNLHICVLTQPGKRSTHCKVVTMVKQRFLNEENQLVISDRQITCYSTTFYFSLEADLLNSNSSLLCAFYVLHHLNLHNQ